jgi:hypothetical protein
MITFFKVQYTFMGQKGMAYTLYIKLFGWGIFLLNLYFQIIN